MIECDSCSKPNEAIQFYYYTGKPSILRSLCKDHNSKHLRNIKNDIDLYTSISKESYLARLLLQ